MPAPLASPAAPFPLALTETLLPAAVPAIPGPIPIPAVQPPSLIPDPRLPRPGIAGPTYQPSPPPEGHVALSGGARDATTAGGAEFRRKKKLLRGGVYLDFFSFPSVSGTCRSFRLAGGGWAQL